MSDVMEPEASHSVEFDLDRQIEALIVKMASNSLTPAEEAEFVALSAYRSNLMRPPTSQRRNADRLRPRFAG